MKRKTAKEILAEGITPEERHDWLRGASINELRDCLRWVEREKHWGIHVRDYLDIRIAKRVLILSWLAGSCGVIQAIGVFWAVFCRH
jgi:hypothetical protein